MDINPNKIDFEKIRSNYTGDCDNVEESVVSQENSQDTFSNSQGEQGGYSKQGQTDSVGFKGSGSSLLGGRELILRASSLYKSRFKTLIGVALVTFVISFVLLLILNLSSVILSLMTPPIAGFTVISSIIFFIAIIIFIIVMIVVNFWGQVALIYAIKDSNENIGVRESFARAKSKINHFFIVSLISGFIVLGGFLFFAIPGIIFSIWFSFAKYIVITEDVQGMNALLKSREYVRGHWWVVLSRLMFLALLLIGFYLIFGILLFVLAMVLSFIIKASIAQLIISLLGKLIFIFVTPFATIYTYLIYENLRNIKGSFEFQPSQKS